MEGAGHEGVVVGGIAEYDELRRTDALLVFGGFGRILHDVAHQPDGIHVDAGLGGAHVDAGAHHVGGGERLGNGADEQLIAARHALADDGREATEEVDANGLGRFVEGLRDAYVVADGVAASGANERNGGDADALVDDGDANLAGDGLTRLHQIFGQCGNLIEDLIAGGVEVAVGAVEQTDAHRNGSYVEVLLFNHAVGLKYF